MHDFPKQPNHDHGGAAKRRVRCLLARVRDTGGVAMVEFALVLPLVLLVVVGIVSFGRAMNYDEQATHLANEAVRYAAVGQVPPGATGTLGQWVRSQADTPELKSGGTYSVRSAPTVCLSYPNGTSNLGDPVQVSMSFTFYWLPILNAGPSSTITRTATMRIEQAPTGSFYSSGCS
jgi:Flp pilus assembly pilin Flp